MPIAVQWQMVTSPRDPGLSRRSWSPSPVRTPARPCVCVLTEPRSRDHGQVGGDDEDNALGIAHQDRAGDHPDLTGARVVRTTPSASRTRTERVIIQISPAPASSILGTSWGHVRWYGMGRGVTNDDITCHNLLLLGTKWLAKGPEATGRDRPGYPLKVETGVRVPLGAPASPGDGPRARVDPSAPVAAGHPWAVA